MVVGNEFDPVIDTKSRQLTPESQAALEALARLVITNLELRRTSADLAKALAEVKVLSGMVPICAYCKKIRVDAGFWQQLEVFIRDNTEATFSHGICPKCAREHFPGSDSDEMSASE